jgi:release factor glutamine methyltransferase
MARLRDAALFGADKPDETPETTARALWRAAVGSPGAITAMEGELPPLADTQALLFEELIERRVNGEPLAYLTGRQAFMGLVLHAAHGALIPRRETELLGEAALECTRDHAEQHGSVSVLDIGTGSGNLAVAIAVHEPRSNVWASDIEAEALAVAEKNVAAHRVTDRVTLLQGDLFGALAGRSSPPPFDVIVCNPPYISSQRAHHMPLEVGGYEPTAAFDGGGFGLTVLLRLIAEAPQYLVPGGWLGFELGAGQGPLLEKRLLANGAYTDVRPLADAEGTTRGFFARRVH